MALVKLGALTQDVRGSLNGSVFSRNRGGSYVRSKVSPLQPVSEYSANARTIFKGLSMRWANDLSALQRAGWISFASTHQFINVFGDSIVLSGIAMFEAVNIRVRQVGEPYIDDAPSSFVVADLGGVTTAATFLDGAFSALTFVPGRELEYNEGLYIFITPGIGMGRLVQKTDYRLINTSESGLFLSGEELMAWANGRFEGAPWGDGQFWSAKVAALNKTTGAMSGAVVLIAEV